jgi:hypothetical protein
MSIVSNFLSLAGAWYKMFYLYFFTVDADGSLASLLWTSKVLLLTILFIPKRFDLLVEVCIFVSIKVCDYFSIPFFFIYARAAATLGGEGGYSIVNFLSFRLSSLTTSPIVIEVASTGKPYIPVTVPYLIRSCDSGPENIWLWWTSTFSGKPDKIHWC